MVAKLPKWQRRQYTAKTQSRASERSFAFLVVMRRSTEQLFPPIAYRTEIG
jgi:hypothetical protein